MNRAGRGQLLAPAMWGVLVALTLALIPPARAEDVELPSDPTREPRPFAPQEADGRPLGMEIGNIADVDLDAMRRIIDASDGFGAPVARETRPLSLEEAVRVALEENLDLRVTVVSVDQGEQDIREARAKFHPALGIGGDAYGNRRANDDRPAEDEDHQTVQITVDQELPTGGRVQLGAGYQRDATNTLLNDEPGEDLNLRVRQLAGLSIEVRQPLLRGGRVFVARRNILLARYDDEINRATLNGEMLRVTAETKAAYYDVVRAYRQMQVIEKGLERDRELLRASNALFEAGRVSKVDVYSAEIRLSNDLSRLATAKAEYEASQNNLRQVIGLPIDVAVEVTSRKIPFTPIRIELDRWIEQAWERRPELIGLRSQMEKADLAVRLARNDKLPNLNVLGQFQPGFDWESYNWRAGLTFSVPLGNVAADSRLTKARLERDKLQSEYLRTQREIDVEVREIEIQLRESVKRLRNLTGQVESARAKGEVARGRFEMGLANNLDVTNADEELIRSESQLLQALVDYNTNLAVLEARIGGPIER